MSENKTITITGFGNKAKKDTPEAEKLPSSWLAQIVGWEKNEKGYPRLRREFVEAKSMTWVGKKTENWPRWIKTWSIREDGLYEISRYESQKHAEVGEEGGERYFAQVFNGVLRKIEREELEALLPNPNDTAEENENE